MSNEVLMDNEVTREGNTFSVKVSESDSYNLQKLNCERDAYKEVISTMLSDPNMDINTEAFSKYHERYIKASAAYQTAQLELDNKYRPEETKGHAYKWLLDYSTSIITYSQVCDCEDLSVKCQ